MTEAFGCTATIMVQSSDKGTFTFPADVKGCTQTA
jgi:hypothetical protein